MTQKDALTILKTGANVFLTGFAGSGKTYVLRQYISYLKQNKVSVAVTASTGIAASHMDGMTIHSWSGLGIKDSLSLYDLEILEDKKYLHDRFAKVKVLIIDEISMLHHYRLDLVDKVLKHFKRNSLPFGGMQVILCGDFFQLPPISRSYQGELPAKFAFHSQAWQELDLKVCYLTEFHRHNDQNFINILNAIRENKVDESIVEALAKARNSFSEKSDSATDLTKLYTHNEDVDSINLSKLNAMPGENYLHRMATYGKDMIISSLKNSCLAPDLLNVKVGASVMFVKNNYEAGYVNGTLGKVVSSHFDHVKVKTSQGKIIEARAEDWVIEENGKVKARISQIPLRLAWAITVHKSQGMTLEKAEIDLSRAFERGMGYVALSRVRDFSGLFLKDFNATSLLVNSEVLEQDKLFIDASEKNERLLHKLSTEKINSLVTEFLEKVSNSVPKATKLVKAKGSTFTETEKLLREKKSLAEIAKIREFTVGTIISHVQNLVAMGKVKKEEISHITKNILTEKEIEKIIDTANDLQDPETGSLKLVDVKEALENKYSFDEIKLAMVFA
jgi:ATP-dependent DNA helicase PIF1